MLEGSGVSRPSWAHPSRCFSPPAGRTLGEAGLAAQQHPVQVSQCSSGSIMPRSAAVQREGEATYKEGHCLPSGPGAHAWLTGASRQSSCWAPAVPHSPAALTGPHTGAAPSMLLSDCFTECEQQAGCILQGELVQKGAPAPPGGITMQSTRKSWIHL